MRQWARTASRFSLEFLVSESVIKYALSGFPSISPGKTSVWVIRRTIYQCPSDWSFVSISLFWWLAASLTIVSLSSTLPQTHLRNRSWCWKNNDRSPHSASFDHLSLAHSPCDWVTTKNLTFSWPTHTYTHQQVVIYLAFKNPFLVSGKPGHSLSFFDKVQASLNVADIGFNSFYLE